MHLVFKTIHGEILWSEKFEVESIELFVDSHNKRAREMGSSKDLFFVESPRQIREMDGNGKIAGTYHLCDGKTSKLI